MNDTWERVDAYLTDTLLPDDPVLADALARSGAAGLPAISVSPLQGALLHILARLINATRVLEIGTLGGYSSIWLGRALAPGGRLVTLEVSPAHAAVARENITAAGLADCVEVRVGPALSTLPMLAAAGLFDLVFIDADKPSNPGYVEWALRLTRPGGLIILDNVVRDGRVLDPAGGPDVAGVRAALDLLAADPRLIASGLQTVGAKGYDGLVLAYLRPDPA